MDIPISAAKEIAEKYDYDQVIIVARKVGRNEHCTTYGRNKEHCTIAAKCGDFLKYKVMGWHKDQVANEVAQETLASIDRKPSVPLGAINIILEESKSSTDVYFVEIENDKGESISIGERTPRDDAFVSLRIMAEDIINHLAI